ESGGFAFYHYDPSLMAAVLFTISFILTALFHVYQLIRTRTWFFVPLAIARLGPARARCCRSTRSRISRRSPRARTRRGTFGRRCRGEGKARRVAAPGVVAAWARHATDWRGEARERDHGCWA
ncbi:hypothetical protein BJ546DRAFT_849998, partial [Cryomyces antarcticus]